MKRNTNVGINEDGPLAPKYNGDNRNDLPSIVYHYCSMETFCKIITTDTLKLTNITKSNDPEEAIYIRNCLSDTLKKVVRRYNHGVDEGSKIRDSAVDEILDKYFDTHNPSRMFYAICFSESQNKLSQWEQYAEHSSGVAIGFDTHALNRLHTEESGYAFGPIVYGDVNVKEQINKLTNKFLEKNRMDDNNISSKFNNFLYTTILAFANHAPLFKSDFFSEENEWRLVYTPKKLVSRITYDNFFDFRSEVDQMADQEGVRRSAICYEGKGGKLRSYIELNFANIRNDLIREIVLGPKADVGPYDLDLEWLLNMKGYIQSRRGSAGGIKVIKVADKLRNNSF